MLTLESLSKYPLIVTMRITRNAKCGARKALQRHRQGQSMPVNRVNLSVPSIAGCLTIIDFNAD